jgi:hypothetical protein
LIGHGVSTEKAEKLVSDNGARHCRRYLEALPHQSAITNPAGWLIKYIENAWPVALPERAATEGEQTSPTQEEEEETGGNRPDEAHVRSVLKSRLASGEFDKTIADLEALPYDQYTRFVAASAPIVDAKENRYYISLKGDLYLYVGPPKPENRFFLCTLERASAD